MADGTRAVTQRGVHAGSGFHCVRALWTAGRIAEGAQPAQARSALASSLAGCPGRSAFAPPRLAAQRQLRASAWVVEFLEEALALWGQRQKIRLVRADSVFFDDKLLSFLEQRRLPYIVVARLTPWIKREAQHVEQWRALDEAYSVGEFRLKLLGWQTERRFVVVREVVRDGRDSVGRKLIDVPGYAFRLFVTTHTETPEEIWRDYNRRSDMENRIAELKHDLGAGGFCLKQFFATEAAFRAILLLFNLLAAFQRAANLPRYCEPATLRTQVLTCGAILGRAGRRLVLHLSQSWGGLKTKAPLLDNIFHWPISISPKLELPAT